jgi:hypothetical protein
MSESEGSTIAGAIERRTAEWDDRPVERSIFGTTDPLAIAQAIVAFCRDQFRSSIATCRFYESSMGCVFGLVLEDGREIALKAKPPNLRLDRLQTAQRLQGVFAAHGIPAPLPLLPPTPLMYGFATAETLCVRGGYRDAHDPAVRCEMARLLAEIARVGAEQDPTGLQRTGLGRHRDGKLWGRPHSPIFDFEATAEGAEWIDALARRAQPLLLEPVGRDVIGHADSAVKHLRFDGDRALTVYDWDSLVYDAEPLIVGSAAHSFTMTWEIPVPIAPSLEESHAFIAEFEEARGRGFMPEERRTLGAALTYSMAYTARCEHSRDPAPPPFPAGSYRESLAENGDKWLDP